MTKLFIYCNYSMIYCIGNRCRRIAVLNRKVSNMLGRTTNVRGVK